MSKPNTPNSSSTAHRDRLLEAQSSLDHTDSKLKQGRVLAEESLTMGTEALNSLRGQRETMERSRGRLDTTNTNISRGRMFVRSMNRRVITNKIILSSIIALLLFLIGFLVFNRFIR
ncbi:hypothetical protein GEMRC1_011413 [Eukaryota sp. GEM-RC1]